MNCEEAELETDADTVDMAQQIKEASLRTQLLDLKQIQEEQYTSAYLRKLFPNLELQNY